MPMVSTVNGCFVDHVLHGMCPNVLTFGEPRRNGGFLDQGGMASMVTIDKVCAPSLGTSVLPCQTLLVGVTIPLTVLRMSVCV